MNREELRNAYKSFFVDSEAGKHFINEFHKTLDRNVSKAMDENCLDHLSRAKGNREVFDHIDSVIQETKRGSLPKE